MPKAIENIIKPKRQQKHPKLSYLFLKLIDDELGFEAY